MLSSNSSSSEPQLGRGFMLRADERMKGIAWFRVTTALREEGEALAKSRKQSFSELMRDLLADAVRAGK